MLSNDGTPLWKMLEDEEIEASEEEENSKNHLITKISLNALQGNIDADNIRLKGILQTKEVSVLIDSGSTHNLIQSKVAQALKIDISPTNSFFVTTKGGEKLQCNQMCRQAKL